MKQPMTGFGRKVIPPPAPKRNTFQFGKLANPVSPIADMNLPNQPPEFNFMERYNELIGNRPDRLAYREHALQGPPTIDRGKWAKLGAVLAGGLTGFASKDAGAGMNLGLSSFYEPERKARETWDIQRSNLGEMASMESEDINTRLKGLEMENSNYWSGRDANRADRVAAEAERSNRAGETLQGKSLDLAGLELQENATDGYTYLINKQTGAMSRVGKTGFTTEEQIENEANKMRKLLPIQDQYDAIGDRRKHGFNIQAIEAAGKNQQAVATTRANATVEAARTRALNKIATLPKEEQQMVNNIVQTAARDPLFQNASPLDYLDFDPIRKVAFVRPAERGFMGIGADDENDTLIRERLRAIIAGSYGPQGTAPAVRNGDQMTQPAPNTVTYIIPGQGEITIAPEELEEFLAEYPSARRK